MKKLNILLITSEYPPFPIAGSGMFTVNLIKELKQHSITVITPYDSIGPKEEHKGNLKVIRINTFTTAIKKLLPQKHNRTFLDRRIMFSFALRKFLRTLNLEGYDILHSINLIDATFLDYEYLKKHIKTIISVNDYYALQSTINIFKFPYFSLDLPFRYLHHNTIKVFNKMALSSCDRVIANSKYTAGIVKGVCKLPDSKISVVHRGIDISQFSKPVSAAKYHNHNILFIGGNFERKGGMHLIKAMPKIVSVIPDAKLTIIGTTNKLQSLILERFIKKNMLQRNIKIIKYLPPAEMSRLYADANVFIMPSVMEGLGQVFMEAMAEQTLVIGTNAGGIPEIITKDTGLIIKPKEPNQIAEAILKIFSSPKLAAKMGKKGRERVLKFFTRGHMAKNIVKVYRSTIG